MNRGALTVERFPGIAPEDTALMEAIHQRAFDALHAAILAAVADPGSIRASDEDYKLITGTNPNPTTPDYLSGLGHGEPVQHAHLSLIQHDGWQVHATALWLSCGTRHLLLTDRPCAPDQWGVGVPWHAGYGMWGGSMRLHLWRSPDRPWFTLEGWRYDLQHPFLRLISRGDDAR